MIPRVSASTAMEKNASSNRLSPELKFRVPVINLLFAIALFSAGFTRR